MIMILLLSSSSDSIRLKIIIIPDCNGLRFPKSILPLLVVRTNNNTSAKLADAVYMAD